MLEKFLQVMKSDKAYAAKFDEGTLVIEKKAKDLAFQYNNTSPYEEEKRKAILKELFQDENLNVLIEPPFHCDYGFNIHFEGFAFVNYNCSILDTSPVHIGDGAFNAPGVCISCAGHGIHLADRMVYNTSKPIYIGKNVWIGLNATILKGTIIGDNCIVSAGSIVKGEFPCNSIITGNPAKIVKQIEF